MLMLATSDADLAAAIRRYRALELKWLSVAHWVALTSIVLLALVALRSAGDAVPLFLLPLAIATAVTFRAVQAKRQSMIAVSALGVTRLPVGALAVSIVSTIVILTAGVWTYLHGTVYVLSLTLMLPVISSPPAVIADFYESMRLASEIEELSHTDVVVPIHVVEGSRFAIRDVTLRFEPRASMRDLIVRLAKIFRFHTVSVREPIFDARYARAVARPMNGLGLLGALLHREGVIVQDGDVGALEPDVVLAARI